MEGKLEFFIIYFEQWLPWSYRIGAYLQKTLDPVSPSLATY